MGTSLRLLVPYQVRSKDVIPQVKGSLGSVIFEELSSVSLESKTTSSPSISGVRVFTNFQGLRYVPFTGVSNVTLNGA